MYSHIDIPETVCKPKEHTCIKNTLLYVTLGSYNVLALNQQVSDFVSQLWRKIFKTSNVHKSLINDLMSFARQTSIIRASLSFAHSVCGV